MAKKHNRMAIELTSIAGVNVVFVNFFSMLFINIDHMHRSDD
jgi:hypothetical protein